MTATTTLILGGGFAGLSTALHLRQQVGGAHRIILAERSPTFSVGATRTWVMLGEASAAVVTHSRAGLAARGIELRLGEVQAIDPSRRSATVDGEILEADHLVIALGADLDMAAVPGLAGAAETFYTLAGAERLRDVLRSQSWQGTRLVVLIPRAPFQCPPAPYEAALLLADHARRRNPGGKSTISLYTVEPAPMPSAGPLAGEQVKRELARQNVEAHFLKRTGAVDPERKTIHFDDGSEVGFDLLVAIPPHAAPRVVASTGLLNAAGWVPVDARTLEVAGHANVFAVGDVASVPLPGRFKPDQPLVLPKAGVFAEAQGRVVAACIAGRIQGRPSDARFDGKGFCFIETAKGQAVRGDGSFFTVPQPEMKFTPPDASQVEAKKRWVADFVKTVLG